MTARPLFNPTRFGTPAGRRGAPSNLSLLCKNNCRSSAGIVDVDQRSFDYAIVLDADTGTVVRIYDTK